MLTFETTHEYYLGENTCLHFCEDHGTLIITPDHEDRVLISGIKKETMLAFATKLYRDDLNKTLESIKNKDVDELTDKELLAKVES